MLLGGVAGGLDCDGGKSFIGGVAGELACGGGE